MTAFAPGPWRWEMDHANDVGRLCDSADQVILGSVVPLTQDDARLIAAAPEMYEVLVHIANDPDLDPSLGWRRNIRALLARIDGKEDT